MWWASAPEGERNLVNLTSRLTIEESRNSAQEDRKAEALSSWAQRGKTQRDMDLKGRQKTGKCYVCGETGHWARNCQQRKGNGAAKKNVESATQRKNPCATGLASVALTSSVTIESKHGDWILDSGASDHMCNQRELFLTYESFDTPRMVCVGDGGCIEAQGQGHFNMLMFDGHRWNKNYLVDVLHVPKLKYNLFSVGTALDKGFKMQSTRTTCELTKNENTVAVGVRRGKLFSMKFKVIYPGEMKSANKESQANVASTGMIRDWHERLVHQNLQHVKEILGRFHIRVKSEEDMFCEACAMGKMHRLPFPNSESRANAIGELIHADLCGPMETRSIVRSRYYLLLKDNYSHFRVVYFIENKAQTTRCIENFIKKAEKQCPNGVRTLRTDNGLEFVNHEMRELTHQYRIRHQRTVVYTPEQNGSAERDNRTLMEASRTLLNARKFEPRFWAEAVNTVVSVLNLTGTSSVKRTTPHELWVQKEPRIKDLRIFGEEVFTHIPKQKRQKLDAKAKRGFFVGYDGDRKGYRIWYPEDDTIQTVRDVVFTGGTHQTPKKEQEDNELLIEEMPNPSEEDNGDSEQMRNNGENQPEEQIEQNPNEIVNDEPEDAPIGRYHLNDHPAGTTITLILMRYFWQRARNQSHLRRPSETRTPTIGRGPWRRNLSRYSKTKCENSQNYLKIKR
jgi:transposase InsO family protein